MLPRASTAPVAPASRPATTEGLLQLACVDLHHRRQEPEGLVPLPLERVPADDRSKASAVADGPVLVIERLVVLPRGTAREDHDPLPVERRLHDVTHALRQGSDRHPSLLLRLLRLGPLDVLG